MVNKIGLSVSCLLLFWLSAVPAVAQFEGKIVFNSYDVASDGTQTQSDQFSLFLTQDRIMLEGTNEYRVMGPITTEGILVRLDFEDFVFLTGDQTAMKISKQDINSMMQMFGSGNTQNTQSGSMNLEEDTDVNYQRTGEAREINGYSCEKFIFKDTENPNNHAEIWMTDELDISWGMLGEPWGNADIDMLGDQLSFDVVFRDGFFPLLMEGYESGNLRSVTKVQEISQTGVARAMVQIPQGVKVLSFQDYLFNKMSEQ